MGSESGAKHTPVTGEGGKGFEQAEEMHMGRAAGTWTGFALGPQCNVCHDGKWHDPWCDVVQTLPLPLKKAVLCASGEASGRNCLGLSAQQALKLHLPGSSLFPLEFAQLCAVVMRCETRSP